MQLVLALVSLNAGKLRDGQNLHEKKKKKTWRLSYIIEWTS